MKKIFILLLFFICVKIYAQVVVGQFLIGGIQDESSSSTIQLSNGDYLFSGTTASYGNGGTDLLIIRFNPDFTVQWQKTIGGAQNDYFNSIAHPLENSDGSIMFLGISESFGMGGNDMLLIKIDALGNIIWSKVYGGLYDERACVLKPTLDNGFIVSGSSDSYNTISSQVIERDLILIKLDSVGNVVWSKTWGTTDNDDINSANVSTQISDIKQLPDSTYLICGIFEGIDGFEANNFIARISSTGSIIWFKKYTSSSFNGHEVINSLAIQNNTNAFACGLTSTGSIGLSGQGLLINFNINTGNVNWAKNYGNINSNYNWIFKNYMINPNKLILSMYEDGDGFGNYDISCFTVDSNGIITQQRVFGTSNFDLSIFFTPTIDSGYIFSGISGNGTLRDSYIIKTDAFLNSDCNDTILTISSANLTLNPQTYHPTEITTINSSPVNLTSNPVNANVNTLCIDTLCLFSSNFSYTSTCLGDSTYFTDLTSYSSGNTSNWKWYFGDGDSLIGIQNPVHLYSSSGTYNVTLVTSDGYYCIDSTTINVTIDTTSNTILNQAICQGDSILIDGNYETETGVYTENILNTNGCDSIVTYNLTVNPFIPLNISVDSCGPTQLLVSGANSYTWQPSSGLSCTNCPNPIANPNETTTYTVQVNGNSCVTNNTITIYVDNKTDIFVPNVFTPNLDGFNDGFNIYVNGYCIDSIHKIIYNRWGMSVYESTQLNEVWDGTTPEGVKVPDGTYYYIFTVKLTNQVEDKIFKGSLTLLR